jgi:hypothetical protein
MRRRRGLMACPNRKFQIGERKQTRRSAHARRNCLVRSRAVRLSALCVLWGRAPQPLFPHQTNSTWITN